MKFKSARIKNMNDLVGGILLMLGGLWLMISKNITEGRILQSQSQGLIQADTYIRMLGGLVFFLAILMSIRSINFKKEEETEPFVFNITKESFLTFVALVLFIVFLKPLGFAVTTFLFSSFVVSLYMLKEIKGKGLSRKQILTKIAFAGVFSLVLVVVVYLVFAKGLLVTLP